MWELWGVEISPLPLKRHIAYTTACCYRTSRDYLVSCRLSTDPKIHDLEILNGYLTLNFNYYEPHFSN